MDANISVIIPTHNRSELLARAIRSVLDQTYNQVEIIVVDDASTDNTKSVVESFRAANIKYIRHETNMGGSASRNTGIKNASYEYIAFLDDDDEWLPEKLEYQMGRFIDSEEAGAIYTGFLKVDAKSGKIINITIPKKRGYIFEDLLIRNVVGTTSTVIVKKALFDKVGLFDERLRASQDADMWRRLSKDCFFEYIDIPLVKYYVHEGARISDSYDAAIEATIIQIEKHKLELEKRRKIYSLRYFKLGKLFLKNGDTKNGKVAFAKALKIYPYQYRYYFFYILSMLGNRIALIFFRREIMARRAYSQIRNVFRRRQIRKSYP